MGCLKFDKAYGSLLNMINSEMKHDRKFLICGWIEGKDDKSWQELNKFADSLYKNKLAYG